MQNFLPPDNRQGRIALPYPGKDRRSSELEKAAPYAFAQISEENAIRLSIKDDEMVGVRSRKGIVRIAMVGNIEVGYIFTFKLWVLGLKLRVLE
jgi:predicted molibdopterin-dependent oxidoreductase YjgC